MSDKVYADGIFGSEREGQPDWVVGNMAIIRDKFIAWLEAQEPDARGYIRLNVTRQKEVPTKWSVSLDTWKPKQQDEENLPF